MADARYKVTQEDIHEMRHLRKTGMTYAKIAKHFGISSATAVYWCNSEYRKKHREKVAKRTHKKGDQRRIQRDMKKRKKNWLQHPDSRLRHDIQTRMSDKRKGVVHTIKGMPVEEAKKLIDDGKLKMSNGKMED